MTRAQLMIVRVLTGVTGGVFLRGVLAAAGMERKEALRTLWELSTAGMVSYEPEGWRLTRVGERIGGRIFGPEGDECPACDDGLQVVMSERHGWKRVPCPACQGTQRLLPRTG